MKNVNTLVQAVKEQGTESIAYKELFNTIYIETIVPKAESFEWQLKGNIQQGIDEGINLIMELVESWNGSGNFHSFFKTSYTNRLINLVKYIGRDKRKHNYAYDVSLSETIESQYDGGNEMTVIDRLYDKSLYTEFDITESENQVEILLEAFRKVKPEQADLLDIMINLPDDAKKNELTSAVCEYYGVNMYTSVIQKRVSRAREAFKNFLLKNNYAF